MVVSAHGGCGASTLAVHLGVAQEPSVDTAIASAGSLAVGRGGSGTTLVVAQATTDGLSCAAGCLHRLHMAGYLSAQLHLVLVADGRGPAPVSVRARLRLLRPSVAEVHLLPHVQRWRYEDAHSRTPSRRYARSLDPLRALVTAPSGAVSASRPAQTAAAPSPPLGRVPYPGPPQLPPFSSARATPEPAR